MNVIFFIFIFKVTYKTKNGEEKTHDLILKVCLVLIFVNILRKLLSFIKRIWIKICVLDPFFDSLGCKVR